MDVPLPWHIIYESLYLSECWFKPVLKDWLTGLATRSRCVISRKRPLINSVRFSLALLYPKIILMSSQVELDSCFQLDQFDSLLLPENNRPLEPSVLLALKELFNRSDAKTSALHMLSVDCQVTLNLPTILRICINYSLHNWLCFREHGRISVISSAHRLHAL